MKKIVIILFIVIIIGIVAFLVLNRGKQTPANTSSLLPTPTPTPAQNIMNKNGVLVEILKQGTGEEAKSGEKVTVNYVGTFENGMKFDSSIDRGVPFSFVLGAGQVIRGWDIGVEGMKVGEKIKLTIPPDLAYGANGVPGAIPPNSTLIFEVELLSAGK